MTDPAAAPSPHRVDSGARWHDTGITAKIHDALRDRAREQEGRDTEPTAGVIDSQSVKGAHTVLVLQPQ